MSIYKKFKGQSQNYKVIIHREKASLTNFFFAKNAPIKTLLGIVSKDHTLFFSFCFPFINHKLM